MIYVYFDNEESKYCIGTILSIGNEDFIESTYLESDIEYAKEEAKYLNYESEKEKNNENI